MNVKMMSKPAAEAVLAQTEILKDKIRNNPEIEEAAKTAVMQQIEEEAATIVANEIPNTAVYQIAVGALAALVLCLGIGALLITAFTDKEVPTEVWVAMSTGLGALAGMVVPSPKTGG